MSKKPLHRTYWLLLLSCISLLSGSAIAQVKDAKQLYQRSLATNCTSCHSGSATGIPSISSLTSKNMLARLQEYKNGTRPGTIMPQLSKGYTDEQLETIALQLGQKP